MTAIDAALAVKAFLWEYGSSSSPESKDFYDRNVSILTGPEATAVLGYASIALVVVTMEGLCDPITVCTALRSRFPEFQMESINNWALGIYAADKTPLNIPKLVKVAAARPSLHK